MSNYKDTIFLPVTDFSMRGNLAQKEPVVVKKWQDNDLYQKLRQKRNGAKKFVLHWGPAYANGNLHMGHFFTYVLKDIVVRSHSLKGHDAPLVPGWDCHGLPIEWKIEESYRKAGKRKEDVPLNQFRDECRQFAKKWQKIQADDLERWGICSDTKNPYVTMDFSSEASIAKEFLTFLEKGYVYKGVRPIMWSPVEKTALADAEVEYQDKKSPAIYVRFGITKPSLPVLEGASCVIWTTTPWTIPGNRAVAYGQEIDYVALKVKEVTDTSLAAVGEVIVFASDLHKSLCEGAGITEFDLLETFKGEAFEGTICAHPFVEQGYDFDVPLIAGHHVTTDAGTGLVHTAPGHGADDFELGKKFGLEIADTITDEAVYADSVKQFAGVHVFKADLPVLELLRSTNSLLRESVITHSYPHSWRSKAPLIFRTTPQWFISMEHEGLREKALSAIKKTKWIPAQAENRIRGMIKDRPDWCLSRQRAWGVPITLYTHKQTGEVLQDPRVNERILNIFQKEGCDSWFQEDHSRFLSPEYKNSDYTPCRDILDVWFESGATQGFVLEGRPDLQRQADLYLEGSDQHRGWFQSSLLVGCGTRGDAPFKAVATHGFTVDAKGHKMSKSLGNTISPMGVAKEMGVEILRLWVVGCDYTDDLRIGSEILKHQQDIYRRYRNTLRYLLGALSAYNPKHDVTYEQLPDLEKWVLHRLSEIRKDFDRSLEEVDFQAFYSKLHTFCSVDLSAFYFDIRKDTLYCDGEDAIKRRSALTVMNYVFEFLSRFLAPVLPFTADEAWLSRYPEADSIHLSDMTAPEEQWNNEALAEEFEKRREQRSVITAALEIARKDGVIGSSLQAVVTVYDPENQLDRSIDFAELTIVSQLNIQNKVPLEEGFFDKGFTVVVRKAEDSKCERCWKVLPEVGENSEHPDACSRCADVVNTLKEAG
ncbi:MAG: isoleucine--tRNA ligase [Alphaproteobacteria bacterium]|nr:isoleucine--tRNA ligase [Alphaproteobacteria bacterium]NCQ67446.1 isoleucine--tRNA ligase [Alphaproteobacteria bacterium]NCT08065.1 isoleucine--tRNA ligase [Alphaproteobacteria bacterium]